MAWPESPKFVPAHSPGRRNLAVLLGLPGAWCLWLGGCTHLTQAELKFLETREVRAPFEDVYDAALNAMFSLDLVIQHSDKLSGVITGQAGDHAQLAQMRAAQRRRHPVRKVTLLLTPKSPDRTQVRMKVLVNERPQVDRKLMTAVWQRIEREYLLESGPARTSGSVSAGRRSAR